MSDEEIQARAIATLRGITIRVRKVGIYPYKEGTYGTEITIFKSPVPVAFATIFNWVDALAEVKELSVGLSQRGA